MTLEEFFDKWGLKYNKNMADDLAAVIAAAVTAERDRCAKVAKEIGERRHEHNVNAECDFSDITGDAISDAILVLE